MRTDSETLIMARETFTNRAEPDPRWNAYRYGRALRSLRTIRDTGTTGNTLRMVARIIARHYGINAQTLLSQLEED